MRLGGRHEAEDSWTGDYECCGPRRRGGGRQRVLLFATTRNLLAPLLGYTDYEVRIQPDVRRSRWPRAARRGVVRQPWRHDLGLPVEFAASSRHVSPLHRKPTLEWNRGCLPGTGPVHDGIRRLPRRYVPHHADDPAGLSRRHSDLKFDALGQLVRGVVRTLRGMSRLADHRIAPSRARVEPMVIGVLKDGTGLKGSQPREVDESLYRPLVCSRRGAYPEWRGILRPLGSLPAPAASAAPGTGAG